MLTNFLVYPARSLKTFHAYHTHHCITGIPFAGHLPFPLFISAMASQQDNQDLHAQESQFREIFLGLSKGQEELRALLMGNLIRKSPEDDKDEQLKRLQAEVDTLKTHMLGQRALIQGLAQEQGELRAMISQLSQGMKQPAQIRDQVMEQLPRGQRSGPMNRSLRVATTSQVQQRPRQEQRVDQNKIGRAHV